MNHPDDELQFLRDLIEENAAIAGDVLQIRDNLWAIHGYIPVDCDVLWLSSIAYDQAANTLANFRRGHDGATTPDPRRHPGAPSGAPA